MNVENRIIVCQFLSQWAHDLADVSHKTKQKVKSNQRRQCKQTETLSQLNRIQEREKGTQHPKYLVV